MKKIIFIFIFYWAIDSVFSQNIAGGEYFFNTEPGIGNGSPLSFAAGDSVEFDFNLSMGSLPSGFNHLYLRFRMDNGQWGMLHHKTIYHYSEQHDNTIVAGEYFLNTEPGAGNGTPMNFASSDSIELNVNIPLTGLSAGFNHLYMRFKSEEGGWGLLHQRTLYVLPPSPANTIISGEFFVDTETGIGNGTSFEMIVPADSLEQDFVLQLPVLPLGQHTLYIRYKTASSDWGLLEQRPFTICESYGANAIFSATENANLVQFQNESSDADSIHWNFGDNTASSLNAPIHFYSAPGNYNVSLLAHNDCGENTTTQAITIEGLESVSSNIVSNTGYATLTIHGFGFLEGTIVSITREGFEDILPENSVPLNTVTISSIVNFTNAALGFWNLQVEIPGEGIFVLNNAIEVTNDPFTTNNIGFTQVQVSAVRTGRRSPGFATVQNGNTTDMLAVPVFFRDIQDIEHINYEATSPITAVPFFAETYQYLLDNGIVNTVMQAQQNDNITNSKFSGYFLPKVSAAASTTIPMFIRRTISGTHHCGAMMIYPQLNNSSQSGTITYENEICWNSFAKAAFESATSTTYDEVEWNDCFGAWKDSLFTTLAELAAVNDISQLPVPMSASFAAILTHMASEGCISNFPASLSEDILNRTIAHILANFTYMNDVENVVTSCPALQGMQAEDAQATFTSSENRENEFCELAMEVGGNSFLNSAGAASQYCKLFGNSVDPNMKYGPGNNIDHVFVDPGELAAYTITFENDSAATAPAEKVEITDQLDATRFDVQSFRWAPIALSDSIFIYPNDAQRHQLILSDLRPALPYYLLTELFMDESEAIARWTFSTLDTTNLQPLDLEIGGFLPPNEDGLEGNGSVSFFINYKSDLITGDTIYNHATIVFDDSATIITPDWMNVIDNTAPASEVTDLPVNITTETFIVNWSGTDAPAGIAHYTVFVSTNDGPYLPWIIADAGTQAIFTGALGNIYKFYSRALDYAGNFEDAPIDPLSNYDAITEITTSVKEHNIEINLTLFPVPAHEKVNITFNLLQPAAVSYEVTDLSGKQTLISKSNTTKSGKVREEMNVSELASGIYLLQLHVGDSTYVEKIIVQ